MMSIEKNTIKKQEVSNVSSRLILDLQTETGTCC